MIQEYISVYKSQITTEITYRVVVKSVAKLLKKSYQTYFYLTKCK